jgi:hypothetical protein
VILSEFVQLLPDRRAVVNDRRRYRRTLTVEILRRRNPDRDRRQARAQDRCGAARPGGQPIIPGDAARRLNEFDLVVEEARPRRWATISAWSTTLTASRWTVWGRGGSIRRRPHADRDQPR